MHKLIEEAGQRCEAALVAERDALAVGDFANAAVWADLAAQFSENAFSASRLLQA